MKTRINLFVMAAVVFVLGSAAYADINTECKGIYSKNGPAIIRVEVVLKTTSSFGGGDSRTRDEKNEVVGTVIDPSGLTVASLASADPNATEENDPDSGYNVSSQVADVKLLMPDGREIPAKVVLRDKDLDLMFIRPVTKPTEPMAFVDMKDSVGVDLLDETLIVTRLGKVANRALSACIERVQSVIEKPRKFYTMSMSSMGDEYGAPVFAINGKVIGLVLYRQMPGQSDNYSDNWMPVVIPADDIIAVAAQAPEDAPKETAKPIETKESK